MRLFVAVDIPNKEKLVELAGELDMNGKRVREENMHITLKFLGEIKSPVDIMKGLRDIKFQKFRITLRGVGAFPNERRARVFFVIAESNGNLEKLADLVDRATPMVKLDHPFKPHLTIIRFREEKNVSELISKFKDRELGEFNAETFKLYSSKLTPSGPIYTVLDEFQLI